MKQNSTAPWPTVFVLAGIEVGIGILVYGIEVALDLNLGSAVGAISTMTGAMAYANWREAQGLKAIELNTPVAPWTKTVRDSLAWRTSTLLTIVGSIAAFIVIANEPNSTQEFPRWLMGPIVVLCFLLMWGLHRFAFWQAASIAQKTKRLKP